MAILVPSEIAEQHARMAEIAMMAGQEERAVRAVRRAFLVAREESQPIAIGDSIGSILTVRIATILRSGGIETIADLVAYSPQELVRIHQIRWRSVEIIQRQLERHGFEMSR